MLVAGRSPLRALGTGPLPARGCRSLDLIRRLIRRFTNVQAKKPPATGRGLLIDTLSPHE
jgi:hypothetical protein